jgi:hypothetical protein
LYDPGVGRYEALLEEIRREFPGFRVIRKDASRLQRAIHGALRLVTAGQMKSYLDGYQTTIGLRVYVTSDWDARSADDRYITMRHELVHLRQFRRYTLLGVAILYLLLPLPLGVAYFRARFEQEAYAESIRAAAEIYGRGHVARGPFREHVIRQFTGPSYGWMWPFRRRLEHWYDGVLKTLPGAAGSELR